MFVIELSSDLALLDQICVPMSALLMIVTNLAAARAVGEVRQKFMMQAA